MAWTNIGAVDLAELAELQLEARLKGKLLEVFSVDKFPKMTDYVVPAGVRIADTARVRLGAYIGEGTTVMHEGFVNFNAGTEGPGMIEGRVSAGVFVGKGSDLGGGCSTMGTLSGGGNIVISVGEGCLIGANAGIGIPLGDRNIVEAGLYITAGTKVAPARRAERPGESGQGPRPGRSARPAVPPQLAERCGGVQDQQDRHRAERSAARAQLSPARLPARPTVLASAAGCAPFPRNRPRTVSAMSLPSPWRADFPAFSAFAAEGLTYLDSAATAQKPQAVLDALNGYYLGGAANVHRAQHVPGERATWAFEAARSRVAHWLHAGNPAEVLFTRGTTEAINLVAYGLERHFRPGDELLVSALEHHANLLPWQLALRRGLVLRVLPLDERGEIDLEQARHIIGERTRLLAISQLSNVLGTWQPVVELIQLARERGAWTLVDGAQGSVHGRHDLPGLGCDFYAFSGHKLYGPDGIGVLWGRPQALEQLAHWQFGGEMVRHTGFHEASFHAAPLGFEAGTPAVSRRSA